MKFIILYFLSTYILFGSSFFDKTSYYYSKYILHNLNEFYLKKVDDIGKPTIIFNNKVSFNGIDWYTEGSVYEDITIYKVLKDRIVVKYKSLTKDIYLNRYK